ncbi:MAG: riboflavin synthase, partial [Egibacteraceae bacterium]
MFTGIVEEVGEVLGVDRHAGGATLRIACDAVVTDVRLGDSISVNGCCVTATGLLGSSELAHSGFTADLMGETLDRTSLGALAPGSPVNLERALRADARLGGHLVQGHV